MKTFLIVGYGNSLRGDDGLGPLIADELHSLARPEGVDIKIMSLPQLDILLVPQIKAADVAIFVDARKDDSDQWVIVKRIEAPSGPLRAGHTTHAVGIPVLLRMAYDWYGAAPSCYLVTPKGFDFSICDNISPQGLRSAECAKAKIIKIIHTNAKA